MKMTGAQIIIETLIEQGVTDVFGYPGGTVINIYDELYKASDRINHVLAAHEQGATHAADGYSRATGKVGVVIATSGPGATNTVTGIATAMMDSIPMVAITGNVPCNLIGKDSFQEIDITGITLPITKHNFFVNDIKDLADTIREAFRIARSGRPGPVLIDVPKDVQVSVADFETKEIAPAFPQRIAKEEEIDAAVAAINKAKKPYIYIGGGAAGRGMTKQIMEMAEKIDACIGCSFMGLSALPNSYDRFLGMQGMHGHYASTLANEEADLIFGVGVRFSDRATGDTSKYGKGATIVQLDPDFAEINKNVNTDVGIVCDIVDAFERILAKVDKQEHPEWMKRVQGLVGEEQQLISEAEEAAGDMLTPKKVIDIMKMMKCTESEAYLQASFYAYKMEPTAEAATGCAYQAFKKGDIDSAVKFFDEAINLETDNIKKAEKAYAAAAVLASAKKLSQARTYCQKAIGLNENYGAPYILIANLYAMSPNWSDESALNKCTYFVIIDKLQRAKQVDPSVAEEANKLIGRYSAHTPQAKDLFMLGYKQGDRITIGGWIGETTTIR